ncbi:GNAT family N-acetyltransferase [Mariniflexile jejuense]|uniref:GNAT family N-acetyltransferase n=1 Tax=Mariniflexile jejuense TaxID=1173582 RepID=A0ABW3JFM9_9FLAO
MKKIKSLILKKFLIFDFYNNTIIKRTSPPFFKAITNNNTNQTIQFEAKPEKLNANKGLHYITYIPPYITTSKYEGLKYRSLYQFIGFLADISAYDSLEAYMGNQFGAKSRSKIRAYCKRLDTCFKTTYKLYYGAIEKQDYQAIMDALETMISRRFNQRGDTHQAEKDWNYYKETTYQLILDKKASLFVIYDNNKHIDICLNYHFNTIMINYIRAFDIDYAKFRLGYIDIYKQLEWCFDNNHTIFDLGAGVFSYKKQWCNVTYKFRNDIVNSKTSIFNTCLSFYIHKLLKLKLYLNSKNIISDKANLSKDVSNSNNNLEESPYYSFNQTPINANDITSDFIKINIENPEYKFLRQPVFEYLYLNFENKNTITIYKINNKPNTFCISGKKCMLLN